MYKQKPPVLFSTLFSAGVPICLLDCMRQMLRYNPRHRITAEDCLKHPYFRLVGPHLQGVAELPRIPLSRGQPARPELDVMLNELEHQRLRRIQNVSPTSVPARAIPSSHSHQPPYNKPAFDQGQADTSRILLPPVMSPQHTAYHSPPDHPSSRADPSQATITPSSSQSLIPNLTHRGNAASALVDQLRELDLPTADLSTYGQRRWPSRRGKRGTTAEPDPSERRASDASRLQAMQLNNPAPMHPSQPGATQMFDAQYQNQYMPPHMSSPTALHPDNGQQMRYEDYQRAVGQGQQNQMQDEDVIMEDVSEHTPAPQHMHPNHPYRPQPQPQASSSAQANRMNDLAASGKKKKWGISSVFSGNNSSKVEHAPPPAANIASSAFSANSLKRTQSGGNAADRAASTITLPPGLDPKKAKKELERLAKEQEKELQMAKREAMARAQKERARAVMAKREQLVMQKQAVGDKSTVEWHTVPEQAIDAVSLKTNNTSNTSVQGATGQRTPSVKSQSSQDVRTSRDPYAAAMAISASRSQPAVGAAPSPHLSQGTLAMHQQMLDLASPDMYRLKARKRDEWDDHSLSSQGIRNPSVYTVGTIDSE